MDQLKELGWAKRWSSQPYVSCRTTSLQELTRLGIKHVENLVIPSVRNDAVVQYMNDLNAVRGTNQKKTDRGSFWTWLFSLFGCCKKDQELGLPV
ncbi:hypothetical protein OsJ_29493 [Oryza sativa Japonica Group]|nr:hypothetical protein OsJ_29493 [Oryza sativa Japonica Group]